MGQARLNPVGLVPFRRFWSEIDVDRPIAVLDDVFLVRRNVRPALRGRRHLSCAFVVVGDRPELLDRGIGGHVELVGVAPVQPFTL